MFSSASALIEWVLDSRRHVTSWCASGVCNRKHIAGGFRGLGFDDVRSPLDRMNIQNSPLFVLTSIFAAWEEDTRLIRLSVYLTVTHLIVNLIVLVCLLVALASTVPCRTGKPPCLNLVVPKPAWDVLSALILLVELCESDNRPMRVRHVNRGGSRS